MHLKECQRFYLSRSESRARVSGLGSILISTVIMGLALLIITTFASVALLFKQFIK
jgi:hypothetical protein